MLCFGAYDNRSFNCGSRNYGRNDWVKLAHNGLNFCKAKIFQKAETSHE